MNAELPPHSQPEHCSQLDSTPSAPDNSIHGLHHGLMHIRQWFFVTSPTRGLAQIHTTFHLFHRRKMIDGKFFLYHRPYHIVRQSKIHWPP